MSVDGEKPEEAQPTDVGAHEANVSLASVVADIDQSVLDIYGGSLNMGVLDATEAGAQKGERYVAFRVADKLLAAPIQNVAEVLRLQNITPVPGVPHWIVGVTNLRGEISSVVDLADFLWTQPSPAGLNQNILNIASSDRSVSACMIVDSLAGIRVLDPEKIIPISSVLSEGESPHFKGVYEYSGSEKAKSQLMLILDFESVLRASGTSES
ncbi:chemotaxis protein CheW [Myxococcota bacterium]|nr:chemotaxis protein CheW [Myxococcota bacterium]